MRCLKPNGTAGAGHSHSICRVGKCKTGVDGAPRFQFSNLKIFGKPSCRWTSPLLFNYQLLVSSPLPGCSILMISAPMSPRFMVQNGPAKIRVKSITRIPLKGPLLDISFEGIIYLAGARLRSFLRSSRYASTRFLRNNRN